MTAQPYKFPKYLWIVHLTVDELYGMQATPIFKFFLKNQYIITSKRKKKQTVNISQGTTRYFSFRYRLRTMTNQERGIK